MKILRSIQRACFLPAFVSAPLTAQVLPSPPSDSPDGPDEGKFLVDLLLLRKCCDHHPFLTILKASPRVRPKPYNKMGGKACVKKRSFSYWQ